MTSTGSPVRECIRDSDWWVNLNARKIGIKVYYAGRNVKHEFAKMRYLETIVREDNSEHDISGTN
jgi:hypothetical protein